MADASDATSSGSGTARSTGERERTGKVGHTSTNGDVDGSRSDGKRPVDDRVQISENGERPDVSIPSQDQQQSSTSPFADFDPFAPYRGAFRRFFTVYRHVMGLLMGGHIAYVRSLPEMQKTGFRSPGKRFLAWLLKPLIRSDLRKLPFPVQLRRRLEILGPTFTKLGQIMAIREDLLPTPITRELDSLMDRLPAIPFGQVKAVIERDLEAAVDELFASIDPDPLVSSLTKNGEQR